ncbi:hypothetical protein TNCV_277711 [Trichonephila clavipes]|nr:hypothetical protein TNCV_277711 [Trichonephila clavipes]
MRRRSSLHPLLRKRRRGLEISVLRFLPCQAQQGKTTRFWERRLRQTTPSPPPTVDEGNLSASMGEESDSESSNSETENTKVTPALAGFCRWQGKPHRHRGTTDFPSLLQEENCFHRYRC